MAAFPSLRATRDALVAATRQAWEEYPTPAGEDDEPDWNLSGAGPALFTYFGEQRAAERCRQLLVDQGYAAWAAPTVARAEFERELRLAALAAGAHRQAIAAS